MDDGQPTSDNQSRRHRVTADVLPLAGSLVLHAAVMVLGLALYRAVGPMATAQREQVVVPETGTVRRVIDLPLGQSAAAGVPLDPMRVAGQMVDRTPAGGARFNPVAGASADPTAAQPFLGNKPAGGGPRFDTRGHGHVPYGLPGSGIPGGTGIDGSIAGVPIHYAGPTPDVVFLCDASGSMLGVFGQLKAELKRSVAELAVDEDAVQRFNVIFFADGDVRTLFADGPHPATPAAKAAASAFIDDQVAAGGTQPIRAIRAALAQRPQVLVLLTDGFDQIASLDAVVDEFRRGDADGHTHVNCIFLQSDEDPKLVAALQEIARLGHGTFRAILKRDM